MQGGEETSVHSEEGQVHLSEEGEAHTLGLEAVHGGEEGALLIM